MATILVVDDDPSVGSSLKDTLEQAGHTALVASSVAEAMTVLAAALREELQVVALPSLNVAEAERVLIERALAAANQNRTRAAALLGISVRTLRNKLNAPRERAAG
jgi:DNA-binding NtrC family response regulator